MRGVSLSIKPNLSPTDQALLRGQIRSLAGCHCRVQLVAETGQCWSWVRRRRRRQLTLTIPTTTDDEGVIVKVWDRPPQPTIMAGDQHHPHNDVNGHHQHQLDDDADGAHHHHRGDIDGPTTLAR